MLRKLPAVFTEVRYSSGFCDCPAAGLQSGDEQGAASGSQSSVLYSRGEGSAVGQGQLPGGRGARGGAVCAGAVQRGVAAAAGHGEAPGWFHGCVPCPAQ